VNTPKPVCLEWVCPYCGKTLRSRTMSGDLQRKSEAATAGNPACSRYSCQEPRRWMQQSQERPTHLKRCTQCRAETNHVALVGNFHARVVGSAQCWARSACTRCGQRGPLLPFGDLKQYTCVPLHVFRSGEAAE